MILNESAIKKALIDACLSQREIERQTGISHSVVSRAFNSRPVGVQSAQKITDVLGVSLEQIQKKTEG